VSRKRRHSGGARRRAPPAGGSRRRAAARLETALAHHRAGHAGEAEALYREVLRARPADADAWRLLGLLMHQCGRPREAVDALREAVRLRPDDAQAHGLLGNVRAMHGDLEGAAAAFRDVLRTTPGDPEAHSNLGYVLAHAGRLAEAVAAYREAIALRPDFPEGHFNLAHALQRRGLLSEAAAHYRRALELSPGLAAAKANLANVCQDLGDVDEAVRLYAELAEGEPGRADYHAGLGLALLHQDRLDEAAAAFDRALAIDPSVLTARWLRPRLLPVLYDSAEEIEGYRARYRDGLQALAAGLRLDSPEAVEDAYAGIALRTNFLLNYQGRDDRELQALYGGLVSRIASARHPAWTEPPAVRAPAPGERVRVGFASAFLWNHTVGKLFRGWVERLDPERFEVRCYHLGVKADHVTERLAAAGAGLFQVEDDTFYTERAAFARAAERIREDRLHVLVYPEIGMDEGTLLLAALRLAPVQCMAWGHPVTSGLPSVDYFLSSELMEPEDGERHYGETLVRLPNLSICYERPPIDDVSGDRQRLGLPCDAVIYLSCQSVYKYLPQYDALFARIAREVPNACFVFLSSPVRALTEKLRRRLAGAFQAHGLDFERFCRFLPRLDQAAYYALNRCADVCLDTPAWSGGNTTLEAVAAGLPVVTWPGPLMRQRHSYAVLRRMGVGELVAAGAGEYVRIAARLGGDAAYRGRMAARVREAGARVFEDEAPVRALEAFLEDAVRRRAR